MKTAKIKVLVVSAWDGASGVLTVVRSLAELLRDQNVTYSAFCFNGWGQGSRWASCCEHLYDNRDISLTEVLVREQFDIVHLVDTACSSAYNPNLWLRRARYRGGIVCMSQNTIPEVQADQMAHVFVACSEASRDVLAQTISAPIRVIANGIDTDQFYVEPVEVPARPVLAWVGRADDFAQKDIHGYLHLAASLMNSSHDFWIADVGNNPDAFHLKDWFGERVHYFSQLNRNQLRVFYNQVAQSGGAIIATSVFEGFHLALAEAAACGCPMIAPRAPGLEWIPDGKIGLVYDRYDGVQGIQDCLDQLGHPEIRNRLVSDAQKAVQECYNSARMASEYYQAYQEAGQAAKASDVEDAQARWKRRFWSEALRVRRAARRIRSRALPSPVVQKG